MQTRIEPWNRGFVIYTDFEVTERHEVAAKKVVGVRHCTGAIGDDKYQLKIIAGELFDKMDVISKVRATIEEVQHLIELESAPSTMLTELANNDSAARMTRYMVTMEIEAPSNISYEHVEEWARFELHDNGAMNLTNPLCDTPIEPRLFSITVKR